MYKYDEQKVELYTEHGLLLTLRVKDIADDLIKNAGSFMLQALLSKVGGDTWQTMAAVDFLVHKAFLYEVTKGQDIPTQHRVYSSRKY